MATTKSIKDIHLSGRYFGQCGGELVGPDKVKVGDTIAHKMERRAGTVTRIDHNTVDGMPAAFIETDAWSRVVFGSVEKFPAWMVDNGTSVA